LSLISEPTNSMLLILGELNKPIEAVIRLLDNPRLIKDALRRTWHAWKNLHGELDFDDLFVVNVLRVAAPESFTFVNEKAPLLRGLNIKSRYLGKKQDERRKNLEKDWEKFCEHVRWDKDAAKILICHLFPAWSDPDYTIKGSPQRIEIDTPSDYWVRLNEEEIPPNEIPDQLVLNAIMDWKKNKKAIVYKEYNLVKAISEVKDFAGKLEQFKMLLNGKEVRSLAQELFQGILKDRKVRGKREDYMGFLELWRLSLAYPVDWHEDWIYKEICIALPVDLRFANDLYYYWRSRDHSDVGKNISHKDLRLKVIKKAKEIFGHNPDRLIHTLQTELIYVIYHFAVLYSSEERGGPGFSAKDWHWIGEVLLQAGKINPQEIVPQITAFIFEPERSDFMRNKISAKFHYKRASDVFRSYLPQALKLVSKDIRISNFDDNDTKFLQLAKEYAQNWLSAHQVLTH